MFCLHVVQLVWLVGLSEEVLSSHSATVLGIELYARVYTCTCFACTIPCIYMFHMFIVHGIYILNTESLNINPALLCH